MSIKFHMEMRIIHEKYVIALFSRYILHYIQDWMTKYQMAIRIHKEMNIIHEKYIINFFQKNASIHSTLDNRTLHGISNLPWGAYYTQEVCNKSFRDISFTVFETG